MRMYFSLLDLINDFDIFSRIYKRETLSYFNYCEFLTSMVEQHSYLGSPSLNLEAYELRYSVLKPFKLIIASLLARLLRYSLKMV
jgi:hypothetical protein